MNTQICPDLHISIDLNRSQIFLYSLGMWNSQIHCVVRFLSRIMIECPSN